MMTDKAKLESRNLRRSLQQPTEALRFMTRDRSNVCARSAEVSEQRKLQFIRRARQLGFDLHESLALIQLSEEAGASGGFPRTELDTQFARQLGAVEERIVALMRLRGALLRLQERQCRLAGGIGTLLMEIEGSTDG